MKELAADRDGPARQPESTRRPEAPPPTALAELQQSIGNAALSALVSRRSDGPGFARQVAPPVAPPQGDRPTPQEIAAAETWAAGGVKRLANLTPGNTGAGLANAGGGFDAEYDPARHELKIVMRCGVEFVDGIDASGNAPPGENLDAVAQQIMALPELERERRLAEFRWPRDDDAPERVTFRQGVESRIEGGWGGHHEFFMRKRGWNWLGATVKIDLQVDNADRVPNSHMRIRTIKVPTNVSVGARVAHGDLGNAQDQVLTVSNNLDAGANFLRHSVRFDVNQHALTPAARSTLDGFIGTFKGAEQSPGVAEARSLQTPITLTGHASATGSASHNQQLSERRVESVKQYLQDHGFVNVATRVTGSGRGMTEAHGGEDPQDRRVDLVVGDGGGQNTLMHEMGHAFGLGDEYASAPFVSPAPGPGQPPPPGTPTMGQDATHDPLVKRMTDAAGRPLPGAVAENTDSIESVGSVIRPQHYSTFHKALTDVTAPEGPWALGHRQAKGDPLPDAAAVDAGTVPGGTRAGGTAPEPAPGGAGP